MYIWDKKQHRSKQKWRSHTSRHLPQMAKIPWLQPWIAIQLRAIVDLRGVLCGECNSYGSLSSKDTSE